MVLCDVFACQEGIISQQLHSFITKWADSKDEHGNMLLRDKAMAALLGLDEHVQNGCLSHIKAQCGTNRNEALHRFLKPFFKSPRMGISLAYALLMVLIVGYNARHSDGNETDHDKPLLNVKVQTLKRKVLDMVGILPLSPCQQQHTVAQEQFGVTGCQSQVSPSWNTRQLSTYQDVQTAYTSESHPDTNITPPLTGNCVCKIILAVWCRSLRQY